MQRIKRTQVERQKTKCTDATALKLTSDREATEAPFGLQVLSLADGGLGGEDDGIEDEAVLVSLDFTDHLGLVLSAAVVVDDTQTTEQSHMNGHVVLGDSVHGGGQQRSLQRNTLSDGGVQNGIGSREVWCSQVRNMARTDFFFYPATKDIPTYPGKTRKSL